MAQKTTLNLALSDSFKNLLSVGKKAFKHLHEKGSYKPEDLQTEKPYKNLIKSTFDVFDFAIQNNDMPEVMTKALQDDAFMFGSLKANAQLFEASKYLLNDDGKLKPFSELLNQLDKLNVNYNQNYLEAEYEFAVASSQAAAQWANGGSSERYNLQYRTAKDERVRASHQALADITLPKEDVFWSSYYPPNGWRCRCVAVEVLKGKYEESDTIKANEAGDVATTEIGKDGKNRLEIFRFNPGQSKVVFPPKHPYGKVKGAKDVVKNIETIKIVQSRNDIKEWMNKVIDKKPLQIKVNAKHIDTISITKSSVKSILSKGHKNIIERNKSILEFQKLMNESEFIGWAEDQIIDGKQKHNDVDYWQYYKVKIANENSFVCIKKTKEGLFKPHSIEEEKEFNKIIGVKKESPIR